MRCFIKSCVRLPLYLRVMWALYLALWLTYIDKSEGKYCKTWGMWRLGPILGSELVWSEHTSAIPAEAKSDPWVQGHPGLLRDRLSQTNKNILHFPPLGLYSISLLISLFWTLKILVLVIRILKVFPCIDNLGIHPSQGSSCLQHPPLSLAAKLTKPLPKCLVPWAAPCFINIHKHADT